MGAGASRPIAPPKVQNFGEPTYTVDKFLRQVRSGRFELKDDALLNKLISRRWHVLDDTTTEGDGAAPHVGALLNSDLPTDKPLQDKMKKLLRGNRVQPQQTRRQAARKGKQSSMLIAAPLPVLCACVCTVGCYIVLPQSLFLLLSDDTLYESGSTTLAGNAWLALLSRYMVSPASIDVSALKALHALWIQHKRESEKGVTVDSPEGRARKDLDCIMRAHAMSAEPGIQERDWVAALEIGPH